MPEDEDRRAAFERLFEANHRAVRAYVRRRAPGAVEDVVADTFLVAWRRLDTIGDDPLPWLLGVARRTLANHFRAERRRGDLALRIERATVADEPPWEPPATMSRELAAAVASLSAAEREALLLVAWEELEPRRAARAAGCSPAAFRVRLHRARRRVAAALPERPQDGSRMIAEEAP
ncbi:MAG: RNA polymerase sigma factor [Solirubrobacteraceae bacterium]